MRIRFILCAAVLGTLSGAWAQGPFQLREIRLLQDRIFRSGRDYSTASDQILGHEGPSQARQFIADPDNPHTYQSNGRWIEVLAETESFERAGALELAEQEYLDLLGKLRREQGPASEPVGSLLTHLGNFYLRVRDFEQARKMFSEALDIVRASVKRSTVTDSPCAGDCLKRMAENVAYRLQMAALLTPVGRLDFAKGDLPRAAAELSEAAAIGNEKYCLRYQDGLDAIYFYSLVLEWQEKFKDAEELWQHSTTLREKMNVSVPYWDTLTQMAAFYARRGDFHKAAEIAKSVQAATAGKRFKASLLTPGTLQSDAPPLPDAAESAIMLDEIVAMDLWLSSGPDAAAPLLKKSIADHSLLGRGSEAERSRLMAWLQQRTFLAMSVLLDGNPSQERIDEAFRLLAKVQGRFLSHEAATSRAADGLRGTPNDLNNRRSGQNPVTILDHRALARQLRARLFISAALDGRKFNGVQFAAAEAMEQAATGALATRFHGIDREDLPEAGVALPEGAALLDFALWERIDRLHPTSTTPEYGVFVSRPRQPVRYIRLGSAAEIDRVLAALDAWAVAGHARGALVLASPAKGDAEAAGRALRTLFQKIIAPLESSIQGVTRLYVIPDGRLTLTPFAALLDANNKHLLERYQITYLNSWQDLGVEEPPPPNYTPPVIVANPDFDMSLGDNRLLGVAKHPQFGSLPGAEEEAADVAKALNLEPGRTLTGKQAREDLVHSLLSPEILHFATHSVPFLNWQVPLPTYDLIEFPRPMILDNPLLQTVIALAGSNRVQDVQEDGLLTGLEASSLHLSGTRLVVLSSCESGQGTPLVGQGVLGLRAAFAMAGAQGLVMSLWPVDDKAGRLFMRFFYAHLVAGPAEALRLAQIDMLTKSPYSQPNYWAGYMYSGIVRNPKAVSELPTLVADQSLVAPECIEIAAHEKQNGTNLQLTEKLRLRFGGVVRQSKKTAEETVYEMIAPGSDLESTEGYVGITLTNSRTKAADSIRAPLFMAIESASDHSALIIQKGAPASMKITLKGGPQLFPGFKIPGRIPALSAYQEATVSEGSATEVIDSMGYCRVDVSP